MSKITSFDKDTVRTLREDLEQDLIAIGKKYGLTIKIGNAMLTETVCVYKMQCAVVKKTANGAVIDPKELQAADLWKSHAARLGLKPSWLNKSFEDRRLRGKCRVLGLLPGARKYPVLVEVPSGKRMCFGTSAIKAGFAQPV